MLIKFPCKPEADWIDLRRRLAEVSYASLSIYEDIR